MIIIYYICITKYRALSIRFECFSDQTKGGHSHVQSGGLIVVQPQVHKNVYYDGGGIQVEAVHHIYEHHINHV
jgi:hypothetical protein